jgi:hypothetical protein
MGRSERHSKFESEIDGRIILNLVSEVIGWVGGCRLDF